MAEAAPIIQNEKYLQKTELQAMPESLAVTDLLQEQFTVHRAERFIASIGQAALSREVSLNLDESKHEYDPGYRYENLMEALQAAKEGDTEARKMVETNVRTDVVERTIKTGHVTKIDLEVNSRGEIAQYGQSMMSVYANALKATPKNSKMLSRTQAEVRNGFRLENANRQNLLEDYNFVVFSLAADDMTESEMQDAGFFTDTMSVSIQVTSSEKGQLTTETAFVTGKQKNQQRHDIKTVKQVGAQLGVDIEQKSVTEILDTPILVHKSLMPEGVIDIVKLYDHEAGNTFFGEQKPQQDYSQYSEKCQNRESSFSQQVAAISSELIAQADSVWTPKEASRRLHKVSEKHMVTKAIQDESIDAMVFGLESAAHINIARQAFLSGDQVTLEHETIKAKSTARSSSCPSAMNSSFENPKIQEQNNYNKSGLGKKEKMTCPFCKDPNQYGDPCSDNQHCNSCDARVVKGKVVSRGGKKKKYI